LKEPLPDVTKTLIIVWRAKEAHFLKMLRDIRPLLTHLMVVGSDPRDVQTALEYFAA